MSADGAPSPQLLAALRQEIARHIEAVYSAEMATLKRRVDELEAAVQGSLDPSPGLGGQTVTKMKGKTQSREIERHPAEVSAQDPKNSYRPLIAQSGTEEEDEAPDALPESLFNYSVERLAISDRPWRDPAVGFLVLLTLSQNLLMNGFSQMNFKAMVAQHWGPFDQRPETLMDCLYAEVTFMGEPVLFLLVVLVALVIIALIIKSETDGSLLVMYPDRNSKRGIWCFVNFVWFQQMVFVPAIFSVEAAALFSSSADTSALIMNTLAVTFILEIDNILYCSVLEDSQKKAYQELANHEGRPRRTRRMNRSSWLLFWCSLLQMCVHFFAIRIGIKKFAAKKFIRATFPLYSTYIIGGGLRGAVQVWATQPEGKGTVLSNFANFVTCAAATPMWFFSFARVTFGSNDPMFRVSCYE